MTQNCKSSAIKQLSSFSKSSNGATAVEFALIAPVMIAMLLAVVQTMIVFFAEQYLQVATVKSARIILTGQAQTAGTSQSQFATAICPSITALFNCNNLMVDVQSFASFASASAGKPTLTYNANGTVSNQWSFSPGTQNSVVVVRLIYQWPVVGGPLGFMLSNLANGNRLMMGVTAFRVEPY